MKTIHQHEIDAQVQSALETKMRHGYTQDASVYKMSGTDGCVSLGFNFKQGVKAGDVYFTDDGSRCEVLAVV